MVLYCTAKTQIWFPCFKSHYQKIQRHKKKPVKLEPSQNLLKDPNTGMETVLDNLNALILDQCKICLDRDKAFNEEYSSLDVEKEIEQLNPTLRKAVHMLTRSTSEIKHKEVMSEEQQKKKTQALLFVAFVVLH